jgi:hypothetical protein
MNSFQLSSRNATFLPHMMEQHDQRRPSTHLVVPNTPLDQDGVPLSPLRRPSSPSLAPLFHELIIEGPQILQAQRATAARAKLYLIKPKSHMK